MGGAFEKSSALIIYFNYSIVLTQTILNLFKVSPYMNASFTGIKTSKIVLLLIIKFERRS